MIFAPIPSATLARTQIGCNAVVVCLLMAISVWTFGTEGIGVACAMAVALMVPQWLYRRMSHHDSRGGLLLAVVGALMVAWAFYNIYLWTAAVGLPIHTPQLQSDAASYFRWAHNHYHGIPNDCDTKFIGFPLIVLLSWQLLGQSIAWPIAINVMLTLLAVVFIGLTACRLLEGRVSIRNRQIALLAMAGTSVLFYYLSHASLLLKEPVTYFAVAIAAYAIAHFKCPNISTKSLRTSVALFAASIALMAIARTGVIYFILAGVALAWADNRSMWRFALTLSGIALIGIGVGILLSNGFSTEVQMRIVAGTNNGGDMMGKVYESRNIYATIMGSYFSLPVWQKILLLPVTCIVQTFIPFPWVNTEELTVVSFATRCQWGWYAIAGIAIFYLLFCSWRKRSLGFWGLWPFVCFALAAFSTGGSVSRYALPYQPLFVIVALWVVCKAREHKRLRALALWCAAFAALTALILTYSYLQTH